MLNKMKICECVNMLGQNSLDHVNAFFLAPIKCNPSWCTTRVAPNIIKTYKVTHKTNGCFKYIYKSIIIIIMFQFCGFESLVILFFKCILSKIYTKKVKFPNFFPTFLKFCKKKRKITHNNMHINSPRNVPGVPYLRSYKVPLHTPTKHAYKSWKKECF
jgi:hypothetical protein